MMFMSVEEVVLMPLVVCESTIYKPHHARLP